MACKIIYKGKALPEEEAKIEINNDVVDDLNEQAVGKSIINSALLTDEEINQQITDLNKFKTVIENNYFKLEDNISVSSLVINKHIKNAPASLGKVKIDSKWRTKEEAKKQVEENLKQRKLFSKLKRNFGITEEQLNLIENVSADKAISSAEDLINAIESKLLSLNSLVLNSKKSKSATLQQKEQAKTIEQLFNENPELANQVYEALGFNNLRKEYSNVIINQVWKRLASEGITNADSLIGTRETINNKDFNKFWSAVKDIDIQNVIKFFESEKQKALDSYSKYKGEFDSTTGTFTSNDTSFFDNKIKDLETLLQQKQQALQVYSQYLQQNPNGSIEQFKNWVEEFNGNQYQKDRKDALETAGLQYLETTLETLSAKFGLPYKVIFDKNNPNKGYVDVESYSEPTIIINAARASHDTPLHEYGHIFINLIRSSNKNLYSTLVKEILNTKEGKEALAETQEYYTQLSLEAQIEETIVELLGKYARNELNPETGIHKIIKKVWDSILEFISNTFNVNVKDISPNTSIEQLSKLLAHPNLNFNQDSFIQGEIESIRATNTRDKERLQKRYDDLNAIENPEVLHEEGYRIIANPVQYNTFKKELEKTVNDLRSYSKNQLLIDIENILSTIKTFDQRKNFDYDRYPLFTKILKFIHSNLDTALWVINNEQEKGNLDNIIKDRLEVLNSPIEKIIESVLSGYSISDRFDVPIPNFYKLSFMDLNIVSVEDFKSNMKTKLLQIEEIIKNPEKSEFYYKRNFKFSTESDVYRVSGAFENGNISISFSSKEHSMRDANQGLFFKVLPKVIDSISYMFSDLEYNSISFTPVVGQSNKGSELRLKGYNIFAKRLFGQFSVLAENENETVIPIPEMFKNRVHIKENMYQKDRNLSDFISQKSQERLNQIQDIFNENPKLTSIGTPEQYSQYLNTIFPDSKVKDIVYHYNSSEKKFDKFDKNYIGTQSLGSQDGEQGFSFVDNKLVARAYGSFNTEIYSLPEEVWSTLDENTYKKYDTNIISALINPKQGDWKNTQNGWSEMMIKNPDNIHILGSKQDIEGFKDFVQGKQFQKLTAEEKAKTIEQVTKEHRSIAALKDLSAKLAHRIGGKVEFENNPSADWKAYNQGMKSVLNEAYMDESTAFHEIMGHPIIRALKSISSQKESVTLQQMIDNQEIEKKCS